MEIRESIVERALAYAKYQLETVIVIKLEDDLDFK